MRQGLGNREADQRIQEMAVQLILLEEFILFWVGERVETGCNIAWACRPPRSPQPNFLSVVCLSRRVPPGWAQAVHTLHRDLSVHDRLRPACHAPRS